MFYLIIFTVAVIVLDIASGIVKALKLKKFTSKRMREGGFNKLAEVIAIVFGYTVDYALPYLHVNISFSVCSLVCAYLFLMECSSILENLGEIDSRVVPTKLKDFFQKLNDKEV